MSHLSLMYNNVSCEEQEVSAGAVRGPRAPLHRDKPALNRSNHHPAAKQNVTRV